jgi:hypothetical protein
MVQAIVTKKFIAKNASLIGSLTASDQEYLIKHRYPDYKDYDLERLFGVWQFVLSWLLFIWKCIRLRKNPFGFYRLFIDDTLYDPPRWVLKYCCVSTLFGRTIDALTIESDDAAGVFGDKLMTHASVLSSISAVDPQIYGIPVSANGLSFRCSLYRWQTWIEDRIKQDRKVDSPRT